MTIRIIALFIIIAIGVAIYLGRRGSKMGE